MSESIVSIFFNNQSRRTLLKHTGMLTAALPALNGCASAGDSDMSGIVDCHFHLWAADKTRFPYSDNPPYAPDYASTAEQWNCERVSAGISKGIFVLGAPYGMYQSFLIHSLTFAPESLRGVCIINPNLPESSRVLEETVNGKNIVGVRLQTSWLWGVEWGSPHLDTFWKKVGDLDIVLQMHLEPEHTYEFDKMVGKFPGTRVVIDHLGRPTYGDAVDYSNLLNVSRFPNVYMKLSAFQDESNENPPHDSIRPLIRHIVEKFGPERCVWGSNLYRGGMGSEAYRGLFEKARNLVNFLTAGEQRMIFVDNPYRLYKLT